MQCSRQSIPLFHPLLSDLPFSFRARPTLTLTIRFLPFLFSLLDSHCSHLLLLLLLFRHEQEIRRGIQGVSVKAPSFSLLCLLKRKVRFEGGRLKGLGGSILSERRVDEIVCGLQTISEQNTYLKGHV